MNRGKPFRNKIQFTLELSKVQNHHSAPHNTLSRSDHHVLCLTCSRCVNTMVNRPMRICSLYKYQCLQAMSFSIEQILLTQLFREAG